MAVDEEDVDELDLLEELDPFLGRSGAGPILSADLRKSLFIFDPRTLNDFTGELSFSGAGGGFSGDFCLGGVFCFIDGVLVDDLLFAAAVVGFGLADFDRFISLTRAARVEIFSSFFSVASLREEHTLGSLLWLGLSRL